MNKNISFNVFVKYAIYILSVYIISSFFYYIGWYVGVKDLLDNGNYGTIYDWYCNRLNQDSIRFYYNTYEIIPQSNLFKCIYYNKTKNNPNKIIYIYNQSLIEVLYND